MNGRSGEAPSVRQESTLRYAGGSWKGDLLVTDAEELQENDAYEVYVKSIKTEEVLVRNEKNQIPMCKKVP